MFVLPIVLLVVLAVWGGLFVLWPEAVNPKALVGATAVGAINCQDGSLSTYAAGASVLANVVFLLLAATVVLRIAWSGSERKYLRLIEKLEKDAPPAPPAVATPAPAPSSPARP